VLHRGSVGNGPTPSRALANPDKPVLKTRQIEGFLSRFPFVIEFTPGKSNIADAISENPNLQDNAEVCTPMC
jgi:hypothetical protein